MPINNPPGNNPQSGRSVGLPDIETAVVFVRPFGSMPHVAIGSWTDKEVWLVEVTTEGFKWLNAGQEEVTIDWIADEE